MRHNHPDLGKPGQGHPLGYLGKITWRHGTWHKDSVIGTGRSSVPCPQERRIHVRESGTRKRPKPPSNEPHTGCPGTPEGAVAILAHQFEAHHMTLLNFQSRSALALP